MNATVVAVALSLASAVAYASAAVTQQRLAARSEPAAGVFALFARAAWWGAVGLNAGGALLHVAALSFGPLTLVQPLGALTLVAAVPLGARLAGRRVTLAEWRGTALTILGLAALLLAARGAAPHETLSLPEALGVAAVTMTLVAVLTRTGSRHPGLRHATASGFTSGVASALTQTVTVAAAAHGAGPLLTWRVAIVALLVAGLAAGGLLLSQTAYRGGLGGPLALVTLANPLAAAVIGLTLLGERLQGGPVGLLLALVGAAAATRGVLLLTRAPAAAAAPASPAPTLDLVPTQAQAQAQASAPATAPRPARSWARPHTLSRTRACVPLVRQGRPAASSSATVLAERPVTTSDFKVRSAATGPGK
ncbi:DMT family transporter [Streptomyces sp. H27-C3]|uniref:DMT family transporter n=1 Tax=Streptomyces sp. H27-C3 TaxID=3046305 RepID=UPI0024B89F41|nr:DMT family transporter [Streptomyces sp. H27-C3]MDJ0462724.1 DMT family transporter [Streptomyces sp. H27-C3]